MMWDLIRQNRRKSFVLFVGMAVLLVLLGYFVGAAFDPQYGGLVGLTIALGIWMVLTLVSVSSGDEIILKISGAREVTPDIHPRLFNVVEEMKIAAGLPAMPKVYIIDEPAPNAFAIGIKPEKSAVAVTAGLLSRLNRDELQGVIAHEVSHIMNRDSQLMTVSGIMLGSIVLISQFFLRSWWFLPSSSRRYRSSSSGGSPQLQLIMVVIAVALAILAPVFARLLYLAISRKREYLADASAVRLTRYPEGLASALEKISSQRIPLEGVNQVTAPMFIIPPIAKKEMKLSGLGSTHPPIDERIKILRFMSKGADYQSYQRAYSKLHGKPTPLIPAAALADKERVEIREGTVAPDAPADSKKSARDVMDIMRAVNNYAFLACACGLKMKLPPDFPASKIDCPRCNRENKVPVAELAAIGAMVGATLGPTETAEPVQETDGSGKLQYTRKGRGWESFSCACGSLLQLSPAFRGRSLYCRKCGRTTLIKV